jgi:hypothetical protein
MRRFGTISGVPARLLPMNRLRLVAPTNVLDAASRVTMAPPVVDHVSFQQQRMAQERGASLLSNNSISQHCCA